MVTQEEVKQVTDMINWAENNPNNMGIQLRMFKQYNKDTKNYETKYGIIIHDWINGKQHSSAQSDGYTVIEAMQKVSRVYAEKKKLEAMMNK